MVIFFHQKMVDVPHGRSADNRGRIGGGFVADSGLDQRRICGCIWTGSAAVLRPAGAIKVATVCVHDHDGREVLDLETVDGLGSQLGPGNHLDGFDLLGKQRAGAVSGSTANAAHLDAWFDEPEADELTVQFVRVLLDAVPYDDSPHVVARTLREIYDEILGGAG